MRAIMADNDIQGQMRVLVLLLESEAWGDIWASLDLAIRTFADISLDPSVADRELWQACQRDQIILVTANRNKVGPDSMEATIQAFNTASSLPVFTLADAKQILTSRDYANRVVEKLLQYVIEIDNVRGTGRLWLP
jgi:hypothetical protein